MSELYVRHPDTGQLTAGHQTGRYDAESGRYEVLIVHHGLPRLVWTTPGDTTGYDHDRGQGFRDQALSIAEQEARTELAARRTLLARGAQDAAYDSDDDGTGWSTAKRYLQNDHAHHDPEVIRLRKYAETQGLDPDDPEELTQAQAELAAMSPKAIEDYTDSLRWDAYINDDYGLQTAATLIDDPELAVPECCALDTTPSDDHEWTQKDDIPEPDHPGRFRTAMDRARDMLKKGHTHDGLQNTVVDDGDALH